MGWPLVAGAISLFVTGASVFRDTTPYDWHLDFQTRDDFCVWRNRLGVLVSLAYLACILAHTTVPSYLSLLLVWTFLALWFEKLAERALCVAATFLFEIIALYTLSTDRDPDPNRAQTAFETTLFASSLVFLGLVFVCYFFKHE